MFTYLWGKHAWFFLHSIVYQREESECPEKWEQKAVEDFLKALGIFLPCPGCKGHYKDNLMSLSPNYKEGASSLEQMELYLLAVHNAVNFTYNLPQLNVEQARKLHSRKIDWLKNFAYFFKAMSIVYKDPIPSEYATLAQMQTNDERRAFLETYRENHASSPKKMKIYHSLMRHCVNSIYTRLLEMNKEEQDNLLEELGKQKSKDLESAKMFIKLKIDRKHHFDKQKEWHWQTSTTQTEFCKLLHGLSFLLPGKKERHIYQECIKRKPFLIEDACKDHDSFKFWLVRILNELYRTRSEKTFHISPFNTKKEFLKNKGQDMFVFNNNDVNAMYKGMELNALGKDYGSINPHPEYLQIVKKHIETNGRVTFPTHSKQYVAVLEKKKIENTKAANIIQTFLRCRMKHSVKK